jgi:excisionase family DNA binding protein
MQPGRPHIAADPAAMPRRALRVSRVCEILDCGQSEVYRLIRHGQLEAFTIGRRGKRVYADSLEDFQCRQTVKPTFEAADAPVVRKRAACSTAAYRAAMVGLAAKGLL